MDSHLHINWTQRDAGGWQAIIPNLGIVEIYRDKGAALDINYVRAFTFVSNDLEAAKRHTTEDLRGWHYINGFKLEEQIA